LLLTGGTHLLAQQISTLYFMENAPMRHELNPAFQPVSDGYVNITPLGHSTVLVGNNSLTVSDVIQLDDEEESILQTDPNIFLKNINEVTLVNINASLGLCNVGFRHNERGYIYLGASERIDGVVGLTRDLFELIFDGGIEEIKETRKIQLGQCGIWVNAYTELSGGYSYRLNDKWTIGGKVKFIFGQANLALGYNNLSLDFTPQTHHLYGEGSLQCAIPLSLKPLNGSITYKKIAESSINDYIENVTIKDYLTPRGLGAGIDFGFTYKPHPQLQLSAAVNNLGFVVWNGTDYVILVDSAFSGRPKEEISETMEEQYKRSTNACEFAKNIANSLNEMAKNMYSTNVTYNFTTMLSATFNVGVDVNFCKNIIGLGVVGKSHLYAGKWFSEITFGGAVRPRNWFNFALSYSLINNGKYSNFGAGISVMPYDGVNITLAADYIPTSYMKYNGAAIPDKCKGINLALGCNIVWGTNKHKVKTKKGG